MCSRVCPIIRPDGSTSSCLGTGSARTKKTPQRSRSQSRWPRSVNQNIRGLHRTDTQHAKEKSRTPLDRCRKQRNESQLTSTPGNQKPAPQRCPRFSETAVRQLAKLLSGFCEIRTRAASSRNTRATSSESAGTTTPRREGPSTPSTEPKGCYPPTPNRPCRSRHVYCSDPLGTAARVPSGNHCR